MEFPFDSPTYLSSLSNIGSLASTDLPYLRRFIPDSPWQDCFGPWPYSHYWGIAAPEVVREELLNDEMVSAVSLCSPRASFDVAEWQKFGFQVHPLKPHFVFVPDGRPLQWSSRTLRHLRNGRQHWRIELLPFESYDSQFAGFYRDLWQRRPMTNLLQFSTAHFAQLTRVEALRFLGGFDFQGLGCALLAVQYKQEIHALHLAGDERAYKTDGFYALLEAAYESWGQQNVIYWGGAPQGTVGEGIARFKGRFSNCQWPVWMIQSILLPDRYEKLVAQKGEHSWFPSYRHSHGNGELEA